HANDDAVVAVAGTPVVLLDAVTDGAACQRAGDGSGLAAVALADLVAERAAHDGAQDGTAAEVIVTLADRLDAQHATAVVAATLVVATARLSRRHRRARSDHQHRHTGNKDSIEHFAYSSFDDAFAVRASLLPRVASRA